MLTPVDRLIRFVLLPIAVAVVTLHVLALLRTGLAEPSFFVAGPVGATEYPLVAGFRLDVLSAGTPVRIGDRLLRLGDRDLRGAGHLGVDIAAIHEADARGITRIVWERDGGVHQGELVLARHAPPWSRTPALFGVLAAVLVVVFRAGRTSHTRLLAVAFLIGVVFQSPYHGLTPALTVTSKLGFYILGGVLPPLIVYWALCFPPDNPPPPRWLALSTLGFSVAFLGLRAHFFTGGPLPVPFVPIAITWVNAALFAAFLVALVWNFARADVVGRRRLKWVLLGCSVGLVPSLSHFLTATELGLRWYPYVEPWTHVAFVLAPIGILLALARQSLFDVDRILGVTGTAVLVAAPLLFVAVTLAAPAEETLAGAIGGRVGLARAALATVLAILFVPLYRVSRPWIERVLVPERAAILLRARRSLAEQPHEEASFEAVAAQLAHTFGCDAPRLVRPGDPDWHQLRRLGSPRSSDRTTSTIEESVALWVPLVQDDETGAVVGLPAKRSGDVFTSSDLAWAAAIAEKALRRRSHRAEQRLRHFVPANVAEAIRSGAEPVPMQMTATVLFADIRSFTAFAERHTPEQVFASLTAFVESATDILERHGGVVVELRGDAILAVFDGAREAAAVAAALDLTQAAAAGDPLAIGIGIATGPVVVGAVRARSRALWGVIGHAANTAARLEGITRHCDASIAIDAATFRGAGAVADAFLRAPDVVLRGHDAPASVYILPLETLSVRRSTAG